MTKLNKPIKRLTESHLGRPIYVVQLEPPDLISVRKKGTKQWYTTTIDVVWWVAAKAEARRQRGE